MGIPPKTVSERRRSKMAATVDAKSDVGDPNQFEDDQENELLPAEKKESDLNAPEKKKEGDFDDSDLPEKTRHPLGTSCKLFTLDAWLSVLYIALAILLAILLPKFSTLLIICGNWSNTGYFSLFAILNYPIVIAIIVYNVYNVYNELLWAKDRQAWGGVR